VSKVSHPPPVRYLPPLAQLACCGVCGRVL